MRYFASKKCRAALVAAVAALLLSGSDVVSASAQEDEGPLASVQILVVRDGSGKPVKNAQVVLHPVNRKGKATKGEIDLKTDTDGHAGIDGIPYGSIEVQVLAPGMQTFGENYEVKQASVEITVKLKRPGGQYSVYDNHDEKKGAEEKPQ